MESKAIPISDNLRDWVVKSAKRELLNQMSETLDWQPNITNIDVDGEDIDVDGEDHALSNDDHTNHTKHSVKGVFVDGALYTEAQIRDGRAEVTDGDFVIGVLATRKAALLQVMHDELHWKAKHVFSADMPLFAGRLNQDQLLWLLNNEEVSYVESDGAVTVSMRDGAKGHPKGVSIDRILIPTVDIKNGSVALHAGNYIVGVAKGKKAGLLHEMKEKLHLSPKLAYSDGMPLFAGHFDQNQILWLLGRKEVQWIENDGVVHTEKVATNHMDAGVSNGQCRFAEPFTSLLPLAACLSAVAALMS